MTEQELNRKIADINADSRIPTHEKEPRINYLRDHFQKWQAHEAEEARKQQEREEASLKASLKSAYMQNPVATVEGFEKDYPQLKSDYLRREALKQDASARRSQTALYRDF